VMDMSTRRVRGGDGGTARYAAVATDEEV
jgi:hypothetical protein